MGTLAMLTEAFPVVRREHDDRVIQLLLCFEGVEKAADLSICAGDLAVVGCRREFRVFGGRLVQLMGIEEM